MGFVGNWRAKSDTKLLEENQRDELCAGICEQVYKNARLCPDKIGHGIIRFRNLVKNGEMSEKKIIGQREKLSYELFKVELYLSLPRTIAREIEFFCSKNRSEFSFCFGDIKSLSQLQGEIRLIVINLFKRYKFLKKQKKIPMHKTVPLKR